MTTPGKTKLLSFKQFQMLPAAEQMDWVHAASRNWSTLHAIAPEREIELAEAMPDLIEMVKCFAKFPEGDGARAILTKLGLNERKDG